MKWVLFWSVIGFVILEAAAPALSQPRIPLRLPFEFDFKAGGTSSSETEFYPKFHNLPTGSKSSWPDTTTGEFIIDTSVSGSQIFYSGDTIIWTDTVHEGTQCYRLKEDRFVFDTTGSILLYLYFRNYHYCEDGDDWILTCTNIPYRADTVVAGWPFGSKDTGNLSSGSWSILEDMSGTTMQSNGFYGSVLSISGHAVMNASITTQLPPQQTNIRISKHPAECSFDPADHPRILELYSPLGAKIASVELSPGQQSVSIPNLARGLYFIRIGTEVVKVFIPE